MRRELSKIRRNLDGVRNMDQIPGAVVVVDPRREKNAIAEAQRLNLPTIGLADTDCDPDMLDVLIPGNDDAMRSVSLTMRCLADAVLAGKEKRIEREQIAAAEAAQKAAEAAKKKAEAHAEATKRQAAAQADAAKKKAEAEAEAAKAKANAEAVARGAAAHRAKKVGEDAAAPAEQAPAENASN